MPILFSHWIICDTCKHSETALAESQGVFVAAKRVEGWSIILSVTPGQAMCPKCVNILENGK
jgi:hypothetical protein